VTHLVRCYDERGQLLGELECPEGTTHVQLVAQLPPGVESMEGLRVSHTIADEVASGTRTLGRSRRQRGAEPRAVPPEPR
jgi:hypothetical protein